MTFRSGFIALASLALLVGCGDRSISGAYVFHDSSSAALMLITETPDHRFTGTLRRATLHDDGTVATPGASAISGTVDRASLTLVVGAETISGMVTSDGIDVIGSGGQDAETQTSHFAKGAVGDYDAHVHQLKQMSAPIAANMRKAQQLAAARAEMASLVKELNDFVTRSREIIDKTPAIMAMYGFEVESERKALQTGRTLKASGSPAEAVLAGDLRTKMLGADRDYVTAMDEAVSSGRINSSRREALLDQHLTQFKACVSLNDGAAAGTGLDPQTCKTLTDAQTAYQNVLAPLDKALTDATAVKIKADAELAKIWDAAKKALN
jgi:hypothetical protein